MQIEVIGRVGNWVGQWVISIRETLFRQVISGEIQQISS